jgi:antirestriction protein ArdC
MADKQPFKKEKRDYRKDLTDEIIRLIEDGTAPWQIPWSKEKALLFQHPYNAVSGRRYSGINVFSLMFKSQRLAAENPDPRWCTFLQAKEQGWKIKSGSKGTIVECWKPIELLKDKGKDKSEIETKNESESENTKDQKNSLLERYTVFYYTVFHASQVEGIPAYTPINREWTPIEDGETILRNSGAVILHDSGKAFYRPSTDEIHMPPKSTFPSAENYYQTVLHELSHWTGHKSRLDREIFSTKFTFGDPSYAKEELRAEMASLYIAMETGLPFNPHNSASYQESWLSALNKDKNEIFRAARDADRIADYVLSFARNQELIKDETPEVQEKMLAVLRADAPLNLTQLTTRQDYIVHAQNAYIHNISLDDMEIAKSLLLKGHATHKVMDAITRSSPFAQTVGYAQKVIGKAMTQELENALRAAKTKGVRR